MLFIITGGRGRVLLKHDHVSHLPRQRNLRMTDTFQAPVAEALVMPGFAPIDRSDHPQLS